MASKPLVVGTLLVLGATYLWCKSQSKKPKKKKKKKKVDPVIDIPQTKWDVISWIEVATDKTLVTEVTTPYPDPQLIVEYQGIELPGPEQPPPGFGDPETTAKILETKKVAPGYRTLIEISTGALPGSVKIIVQSQTTEDPKTLKLIVKE